jgi:hypothetical protein
MTISGNNSISNNSGNGTLVNTGTITKGSTGNTDFNINTLTNSNTGTIKGVGTIGMNNTTFNSNGTIAPGLSPGLLTVNNNQPLSANSTLAIEMFDGSGAGTGHDQLIRNSNITLAGTLTVTETGTVPNGTYTILNLTTGAVSGSFTTTNLPAGYTLQVNATNVQITRLVILPLRFISFTVGIDASDNILLNWVTDNEVNTSHFDVERSTDGINYQKIAEVASANTSGVHNYSYTDALAQAGINYYRLKQVDINGQFEYSAIRTVKTSLSKQVVLFPNPVVNELQLKGVQPGTKISVYNVSGKQVLTQTWTGVPIQVAYLPKGVYNIQLQTGETIITKKFIKQ